MIIDFWKVSIIIIIITTYIYKAPFLIRANNTFPLLTTITTDTKNTSVRLTESIRYNAYYTPPPPPPTPPPPLLSRFGLAVKRLTGKQKGLGSILLRLSFFFKKVVVCGQCLVTLSLTINETLKWLSLLPILNAGVILVVTAQRQVYYLPPPHTPLPNPFSPSLISLIVSVDVKHHVYLLTSPPPPPPHAHTHTHQGK